MSFSQRLLEERKRLKMNQSSFAGSAGVTKKTQIEYEHDNLPAFAGYMEALGKLGVDILYLVTGIRGGIFLSPEEAEYLQLFNQAAPEVRKTALEVLRTGMVITKQVNVGRDNYGDIKM